MAHRAQDTPTPNPKKSSSLPVCIKHLLLTRPTFSPAPGPFCVGEQSQLGDPLPLHSRTQLFLYLLVPPCWQPLCPPDQATLWGSGPGDQGNLPSEQSPTSPAASRAGLVGGDTNGAHLPPQATGIGTILTKNPVGGMPQSVPTSRMLIVSLQQSKEPCTPEGGWAGTKNGVLLMGSAKIKLYLISESGVSSRCAKVGKTLLGGALELSHRELAPISQGDMKRSCSGVGIWLGQKTSSSVSDSGTSWRGQRHSKEAGGRHLPCTCLS